MKGKIRRYESLRTKVLRKTVRLEDFKQPQKPTASLKRKRNDDWEEKCSENLPKSPAKKRKQENQENSWKREIFNFKMIAANFMRKIGMEPKDIATENTKKENPPEIKSSKGRKFIYF